MANRWYHFAFTREGNTWRGFVDGELDFSLSASGSIVSRPSEVKRIARWGGGDFAPFYGYIDEFRITKGVARYTAAFVPETKAFIDSFSNRQSLGSQENTLYQRSSGAFAWYFGGEHSVLGQDPGVGGSTLMLLDEEALTVNENLIITPATSVVPANNGEMTFEATSNSTITVKYKGSDGVVRTGTISLT